MTIHTDHSFSGWRKSTRSGNGGGDCVEVAQASTAVAVRDSKNPTGPVLIFRPESWTAFIAATKQGAFDR
jgi:hypothetical protein